MEDFFLELDYIAKLAFSLVLGFVVGLEREFKNKPAGMRTNMLIAMASTAFILLGFDMIAFYNERTSFDGEAVDPIRMVEAIIVGISFVGAGAILKKEHKNDVENLTTASTILVVAAIGISVAISKFYLAVALALLVIFVNYILKFVEKLFIKKASAEKDTSN